MATTYELLPGLGLILIVGLAGYWLAWQLRLPALVVVFLAGLVAGPGTGLVAPDLLLGPVFFPAISLAVGLLLFQGGLVLRLDELPDIGPLVLRLLLLVAPLTAGATAGLAYLLLGLDPGLSLLVGSLLALPAPLVIGPLLQRVSLRQRARPALKWEAMVLNPLGAAIAIVLFEAVLAGDLSQAPGALFYGAVRALLIGSGIGFAGGVVLWWLLGGRQIPGSLRNSTVVLVLMSTLVLANWLQPEAGLLAMPVLGVLLANQNRIKIEPVVSFMDSLHVLLIGPLLFVLAARLDPALFTTASWPALLLFAAILLLVVRPLILFVAGWGSPLKISEKLFMGWIAPRGMVPVALGTIFALELQAVGHAGAAQLAFVPVITALVTAAVAWLAAGPLARRLRLGGAPTSTPFSPGVALGEDAH